MAKKLIRIEFSRVSVLRREKRKHLNLLKSFFFFYFYSLYVGAVACFTCVTHMCKSREHLHVSVLVHLRFNLASAFPLCPLASPKNM